MVREIKKEMIRYQKENPEIMPDACRRKIMLKYESMYVPSKVPQWEDILADLGQKRSSKINKTTQGCSNREESSQQRK